MANLATPPPPKVGGMGENFILGVRGLLYLKKGQAFQL